MSDVEVTRDHSGPDAWRVEDHETGELTIFVGPSAEDRARGYAEYQYNHYEGDGA
jgi:hypothetical protein